ncbi:HsdR family type I site-specific deoxyribonuclease [Myroides odoratimimus CCUG 12901]|uniref:type I restriction endonuclease subunit R n=1 Tax=Myroides odoratimimus TaxID=76832 RepID=UPI00024618DB|nr:type I restriction endonuclease subunit R [Myroides odoratimimus]EHO10017.1 HsdR family type I site-specific deoxyribonuclease [Myroides odoratimimus CCUG 12901]
MTTQSEFALENELINQLSNNGYERVIIKDESALLVNLKKQLERFNQTTYTNEEFKQILNHLAQPLTVFEKAKTLRDRFAFKNEDNETRYVSFLNMEHWCQNQYQIANQITMEGKYENRYDVTLLINGLPLVQIELKKRGLELKEAFNQIDRYKKHSYGAGFGLFQYIQIYVISNGVNTKYYTYSKEPDFKFTFYWTDEENKRITELSEFARVFLDKCHISKMITRYTVLHEGNKQIMVLRPYQYYAVERIIERVKLSPKNGYIWHTTGSGKTLTSFKASQILSRIPKIDKVVFCVDRCDLDYQTSREFNEYAPGSIDSTENTRMLVKQFADANVKLIVTTIQKLNTAITKERHQKVMDDMADKKVVFIFDECHRSQFGDTHKRIVAYFKNHQMFGFTGTPIFKDNALSKAGVKKLTKDLFGDRLHEYVITDAISDGNVLPFSIEYTGRYKYKENSRNLLDIEVEAIDTQELLESDERIEKISNYIINVHHQKSKSKGFTGMFCISNTKTLIKYYDTFRRLQAEGKHDLRIATIFSYTSNEDPNTDTSGEIPEEDFDFNNTKIDIHTREVLDKYIGEYNSTFGTNYSTKDSIAFNNYYKDVAKRVRNREVDILFVVNMFLTGFDSPSLNTLYVDKNLKYHGLIQAYSRTNRLKGEKKSHGQIIVFRNLKKATDDAIALFSNKNAKETIIVPPLEDYIDLFNEAVERLMAIAPTVDSVNDLYSENEKLAFVKAFREVIRLKNRMDTYADFTFEVLNMDEQTFNDYSSKYQDLKRDAESSPEKESILNEVDFELELIHKDEINVNYILNLLANLNEDEIEEEVKKKRQQEILTIVDADPVLRTKRELIERFLHEQMSVLHKDEDVSTAFEEFMTLERRKEFHYMIEEENLDLNKVEEVMSSYLFTGRFPKESELIDSLKDKPSFRERQTIGKKLTQRISDFIDKYLK